MTTFDRYLLRRFLHVFCILFLSMFGLFVVIDGFTNIDSFQQGDKDTASVLGRMAWYYTFQSSLFFDLIGSMVAVISVMVVFALLQRHGEIHPVLAAGVPTSRLLVPIFVGILMISAAVVVNQELVLPRISHMVQAPRGEKDQGDKEAEPVYDHRTRILISGRELFLKDRRMEEAKFVLPVQEIALELTTLKAREARFFQKTADRPAGWLLSDVMPRFDDIELTPEGKQIVQRLEDRNQVFVVTDVSFDQLYNRRRNYRYVSTPELTRRIRNPAYDTVSVRGQVLHLHSRLLRPLVMMVGVLVAVPLIVRKESRGLIGNLAVCTGVQALLLGMFQLFLYLGQVNLVAPDLAAWAPVIFSGTLGAWLWGVVQT